MSGANELSNDPQVPLNPEPSATDGAELSAEGRDVARFTLEEVLRPLAIAGMLTCIAVSLSQLLSQILPTWPGFFFSVFIFLICLESIHAERLASRRDLEPHDRFRFRFVEWVTILLITRFGPYLRYGSSRLMADVALWSENPFSFFSVGFIVTSLIVALFWFIAAALARAVKELEAAPIERALSVTDPGYYLRSTMPHHGRTDRQSRLNYIVGLFFGGGVLLLLLTGFSRVDVRDMILLQHPRSSGIILNAMVYFLLGFLIVSQAQYTILRANWELQDIPILGKLGRRWMWLVLGFLLLIGLVAALLPVNYSVGLIDTLSTIIRWIMYVIVQIAFLFLFLLSYVIGLVMRLFSRDSESAPPPEMQRATPPQAPPGAEALGPAPWWQLVRSIIFWGVLAALVGYSIYHFARDRWGLFQGLSASRLFRWLRGLWQGFWGGTRRALQLLGQEIERRVAARRARAARRGWFFLPLGRLSPRDKVRYFYVSILHRSADQGFGRLPAMTPLEYEATLRSNMPEVSGEVDGLTEAFLEARYSEHPIDQSGASLVQRLWQQVKAALRRHRRASQEQAGASEAPASSADTAETSVPEAANRANRV
jgi:hypothetical protein